VTFNKNRWPDFFYEFCHSSNIRLCKKLVRINLTLSDSYLERKKFIWMYRFWFFWINAKIILIVNFAEFCKFKVQVGSRNVEDKERLLRPANRVLWAPLPTQQWKHLKTYFFDICKLLYTHYLLI
jgi:hypothetical protein